MNKHYNTMKDKKEKEQDSVVDEAGKESFPASDPPAWTTGHDKKKEPKEKSQKK